MADTKNVRLIFGDDDYRVQQAVHDTLQEWAPPEERAMSLEAIEGALDSADAVREALDRCLEALLTPAFFGAVKTVWLRDVSFLGKHPALNHDAVKQRLRRLAEWIAGAENAGARLLISALGVDKRTAFFIACKKTADIQEYAVPSRPRDAEKYALQQLAALLRQQNLRAASPVMNRIVERAGSDTRQLANEVEKLRAYLGQDSVVSGESVAEVVSASRQSIIWEFTDTVGRRDLPAALRVLRQLLFQKETPVRLLGMLDGFLRELILYRHAVHRRWVRRIGSGITVAWNDVPPEVEEVLSECMDRDPRKANPYRMGILAQTAATLSMSRLLQWRALIVQTYQRMFSGNIPPEQHMELLLLRMLGPAAPAQQAGNGTATAARTRGRRP